MPILAVESFLTKSFLTAWGSLTQFCRNTANVLYDVKSAYLV